MTSFELSTAELAAAEAVTEEINVGAIAEYYDPANVSVEQIPFDDITPDNIAAHLVLAADQPAASLVERLMKTASIAMLIEMEREKASTAHLLQWTGVVRVPHGVAVGDHIIGYTHRGFVTNQAGGIIGTYERLLDNERLAEGREPLNAMIVFI